MSSFHRGRLGLAAKWGDSETFEAEPKFGSPRAVHFEVVRGCDPCEGFSLKTTAWSWVLAGLDWFQTVCLRKRAGFFNASQRGEWRVGRPTVSDGRHHPASGSESGSEDLA